MGSFVEILRGISKFHNRAGLHTTEHAKYTQPRSEVWLCADILDKMADAIGMFGG